jgi:outer membrane cobalamin receptor
MVSFGKMLRYALCIMACFNYLISSSQGIKDSLFLIPEVEVSGSGIFQKESAGTKTTTVDSVILLEKINVSISSVLAENTSVFIKDYGRGAMATASFRGTAPSHTQVTWNGLGINSPMLGMVDFSLIPVYVVDDMSLQHGAASIASQSGGLGGLINIENRVNWKNRFSGRYFQGAGSFHTFDEFGQVNVGNSKWQSKTRAYHNYSKNNYEFLNKHILPEPELQRNENAEFGKYGFVQEVYFKPLIQLQTSAKIWYQNAQRSIPTVTSDESDDESKTKLNQQTDQTLKAVIHADYYSDNYTVRGFTGFDVQNLAYINGYTINDVENLNTNSGSEMQNFYNSVEVELRIYEKLLIKSGVKLNRFDISSHDSVTKLGYGVVRNEQSVFVGAYQEIGSRVQLSVNLRQDIVDKRVTPLICGIGLNYRPLAERNLLFKGSFARNFRNPSLNDMYWQPGGNENLKPEKGYTWETGMYYSAGKEACKMETELTGYHSTINNWIIWLPGLQGYWMPQNLERVVSKGIEFMLKTSWRWNKTQLYVTGNYAFTHTTSQGEMLNTEDISQGKQLPFIPRHSGNLFATIENRGFYITFQHNSYSERSLLYTNDATHTLYPYHLNHASFGKRWKWNRFTFDAELKVNNLFDEFYRSILNRFMPGRHYSAMIKVTF